MADLKKRIGSAHGEVDCSINSDDRVDDEAAIINEEVTAPTMAATWRHLIAWPICFLFMSSYTLSYFAFGQYLYVKLQKESFPDITINTTTSYCTVNTSSDNYKIQLFVQQKAATWGIYYYVAGGLASIVANVVWGSLTDRFGRRFLFVLPCVGTLIRTIGVIVGIHYDLPLYYYVIGLFLEGLTGQIFTMFQAGFVYISDITPTGGKRSVAIVLMELSFGLGTSIPNVVAGYLLKYYSFIMPVIVAAIILGLALFLMLLLPETYPEEIRKKRNYTSMFENLKDSVGLYFSLKNSGRRWMYIVLLSAFAFSAFDVFGRVSVEGLYLLNLPFCWTPSKIGVFTATRSGFQQIVGMAVAILLQIYIKSETIAIIACLSSTVAFILEGLASTTTMMYIVSAVGTCGLLTLPMARSLMSQMTSPHKQGAVFASISFAETMMSLVSSAAASAIYLASVGFVRGFIFFVFASCSMISFILLVIFVIGTRKTDVRWKDNQ